MADQKHSAAARYQDAISKQMREMLEYDEIGPRIRGEMRAWALTFLGRVPGPDEKVLDLLAEAAARRPGQPLT